MLSDSLLSGFSPAVQDWNNCTLRESVGAEQHPDSQHSDQQVPSKTSAGERSAAEQPVRWESIGRMGPLGPLPLHVRLALFHFVTLDPIQATKPRLECDVGNK